MDAPDGLWHLNSSHLVRPNGLSLFELSTEVLESADSNELQAINILEALVEILAERELPDFIEVVQHNVHGRPWGGVPLQIED